MPAMRTALRVVFQEATAVFLVHQMPRHNQGKKSKSSEKITRRILLRRAFLITDAAAVSASQSFRNGRLADIFESNTEPEFSGIGHDDCAFSFRSFWKNLKFACAHRRKALTSPCHS